MNFGVHALLYQNQQSSQTGQVCSHSCTCGWSTTCLPVCSRNNSMQASACAFVSLIICECITLLKPHRLCLAWRFISYLLSLSVVPKSLTSAMECIIRVTRAILCSMQNGSSPLKMQCLMTSAISVAITAFLYTHVFICPLCIQRREDALQPRNAPFFTDCCEFPGGPFSFAWMWTYS